MLTCIVDVSSLFHFFGTHLGRKDTASEVMILVNGGKISLKSLVEAEQLGRSDRLAKSWLMIIAAYNADYMWYLGIILVLYSLLWNFQLYNHLKSCLFLIRFLTVLIWGFGDLSCCLGVNQIRFSPEKDLFWNDSNLFIPCSWICLNSKPEHRCFHECGYPKIDGL